MALSRCASNTDIAQWSGHPSPGNETPCIDLLTAKIARLISTPHPSATLQITVSGYSRLCEGEIAGQITACLDSAEESTNANRWGFVKRSRGNEERPRLSNPREACSFAMCATPLSIIMSNLVALCIGTTSELTEASTTWGALPSTSLKTRRSRPRIKDEPQGGFSPHDEQGCGLRCYGRQVNDQQQPSHTGWPGLLISITPKSMEETHPAAAIRTPKSRFGRTAYF